MVRSSDRSDWTPLVDPPGEIPSTGAELEVFTSPDGRFTAGLWRREPDTWSFERAHDEVAYIVSGVAEIDTAGGRALSIGAGDVLVSPNGSKGTWRISEPLTKLYAIYTGTSVGDGEVRVIHDGDPVDWVEIPTAEDDPIPPGEEWYAYRSSDGMFSTGVWRRAPETGSMDLPYDELAILIEGDVEVEDQDGGAVAAGPGDVLVTPKGFTGTWRARTPVRKFWVVHKHAG
jgi:uncharacterized cupin superfamily protein